MNPIRTNKPVFFGNDGEVLKSGMIYIGQPNQWPISFPKTVTFQDSAGSQFTAQQPMRTNSQGQIEYNGKAIIALVDGNYSMLVRDRNGVNVNDGYTPFVESTETDPATLDDVTKVGLTLAEIKQFDVTAGDTVRNVGKITAEDELGAFWLVVSATGSPGDDVNLITFTNGTQGKRIGGGNFVKGFTVSIPSNYSTIQDAFEALSGIVPRVGEEIVVNFEAGHQPSSGLDLKGGDYSGYRITSSDRPCVVGTSLTTGLFRFERCLAPVVDTLFDMSAVTASVIGYAAYDGTTGTITPTNGVIFSPGTGLYAEASYITAQGANFNNASNLAGSEDSGIAAWEGAIVNADGATCIESWVGVNAGFGGTINFMGGTSNDCRRHNIRAREKGNINCQGAQCSGAAAYNIYAWKASNVNARDANAQNAGEISINAVEGSTIAARGVTTDGSAIGLKALQSSTIDAPFSSNDNCTDIAVDAEQASIINVESGTGTNATTRSILATGASTINATLFNGNGGVEIRADECSRISARGAATPLFRVETGSIMSISTFTSTNITPNTLDPKGIIFQSV